MRDGRGGRIGSIRIVLLCRSGVFYVLCLAFFFFSKW